MTSSTQLHPNPAPASFLHFFIVENHADTLAALRLYLEAQGHVVSSATSKAEALSRLPQAEFDVLLCDIGLPDGDGWELLCEAELPQHVYAVAMSGFGRQADREKSLAVGFRQHFVKPLTPMMVSQLMATAFAVRLPRPSDAGGSA